MILALQLVVVFVCILGAAFYSGIETGVISIRRLRLKHRLRQGDASAQTLAFFLEEPNRLLGTTLVGTNLCIVVASIVAASVSKENLGSAGHVVSGLIVALCLVVFGEYLPKAWFRARPYYRSARFARILYVSWAVFRPVGAAVTWIAGLIIPGGASGKQDLCSLATRDEIKMLTSEAEQQGILSADERAMIQRTVELAEKPVSEIMTPLAGMVSVSSDCSIPEFLDLARSSHYTRFPVRRVGEAGYAGIVNVFDVLGGRRGHAKSIRRFVREAVEVPHQTPADDVMSVLYQMGQSMGLVTGGGGEVIGLVTNDDVLRQIVHAR